MEIFAYLVLGIVLAAGFLRYRVRGSSDEGQHLAFALVVATFIYVAFAMAAMESLWLLVEIGGVLLFVGFAMLGTKKSLLWLAAGWVVHVFWDVGLHLSDTAAFVPIWYPVMCVSFDLVLAGYIVWMVRVASRSNEPSLA